MTQQVQVDEQVACNWCGLFSRPGAMCDICGSPLVGGHILVLGDERPSPRPKRSKRSRPAKASASSKGTAASRAEPAPVFCAWCGLPTSAGSQCDTCGSPLVGGHILFLPDGPEETAAPAAKAAAPSRSRKPKPAVEPDAEVAPLLPKPKRAPARRRSTRGPKARPSPVRSATPSDAEVPSAEDAPVEATVAPAVESDAKAAEVEVTVAEVEVEITRQPEKAEEAQAVLEPEVVESIEPAIVPESEVDPAAVEIVADAGNEVFEPTARVATAEVEVASEPAVDEALVAEVEVAPAPVPVAGTAEEVEPGDLLDAMMLGLQAEITEIPEAIDEPGPEGLAGMEVAEDEAPAPAAMGDGSASVPVEPEAVETTPEQVREGRRGLARIVRLPRARKANSRSTRRTTTPDAHTPPPDDGLSGTRVRRARPAAPATPPDAAAMAAPLPTDEPPTALEPAGTLAPVVDGETASVSETVAQAGPGIAEIAQETEPAVAPAELAVAPAVEAIAPVEPIPDTDVSFADLFDTVRETPTGSIVRRPLDSMRPVADRPGSHRARPAAPFSPHGTERRAPKRTTVPERKAPQREADRREAPQRGAAKHEAAKREVPQRAAARRILPAGFDPVSDIEAWIRGPADAPRRRPVEPETADAGTVEAEVVRAEFAPTPSVSQAPATAMPGRLRQELTVARPAGRKRKRITCARCGQVSEQSLCEACREAFDALRSLSADLAAGLE